MNNAHHFLGGERRGNIRINGEIDLEEMRKVEITCRIEEEICQHMLLQSGPLV